MGVEFRIEGLDEALREIEKMQKGLTLPHLKFWCERISNDVKLDASIELGESFILDVSLNEKQNPEFDFRSPPELITSVIDVIRNYLKDMPITTRALFKALIEQIQKDAKKQSEK